MKLKVLRIRLRTQSQPSTVSLPTELWLAILSLLSPPEAWDSRLVCRLFRDIVEDHISLRWLRDYRIKPRVYDLEFRRRLSIPPYDLLQRKGRFLELPLPSDDTDLYGRVWRAKKKSKLWYDVLQIQQRAATEEMNRIMPLWLMALDNADTLGLRLSTRVPPKFKRYVYLRSEDSRPVKARKEVPGFRVRYDDDTPALLIDWRVLFTRLFGTSASKRSKWHSRAGRLCYW